MKAAIFIFIILLLIGCKADIKEEYSEDDSQVNIRLIKDRCDLLEYDIAKHDECMREYAEELTTALSEYINVEIYDR